VTGARDARDDVPEIVEPAVRVGGVELRAFWIDRHRRLVNEDVRIGTLIWDVPGGHGLEDLDPHHRTDVSVLDEHDVPFTGRDCGGHGWVLLPRG